MAPRRNLEADIRSIGSTIYIQGGITKRYEELPQNDETQEIETLSGTLQTQIDEKLSLTGGNMSGALILAGTPTTQDEAANKEYIDTQISGIHSHSNLTDLNSISGTNTGDQTTSTLPNDSSVFGSTASEALEFLMGELSSIQTSNSSNVLNKINDLYTKSPDVILSSSGAGDLATAISGLTNGQTLEVRTSAVFNPIVLPSGAEFSVKVADGYTPSISGQDCIVIQNGAANIIFSGFIVENCTSSYGNGRGSAITFKETHSKAQDIIFHNITMRNAASSAVILSYYSSLSGDYATPHALDQMSDRISFVGCHLHKCTNDVTEGASITLRGINGAYIKDCYINPANQGRGIQFQNCINTVIEDCYINNCIDGNGGEGIKIDQLGTISGYRNTAIIRNNVIRRCIEGIDIDDAASCNIIQNNIISECTEEGISVDGGTPNGIAAIIGNTCYKNNNGIRVENGAVVNLKKNVCYSNNTNFLIENGYSIDDSNTTSLDDAFIASFSSLIKNDSTVSGSLVSDALNTLNTTTQKISSGTSRPGSPSPGQSFFDTGLSPAIPIWWNGSNWINASGTIV